MSIDPNYHTYDPNDPYNIIGWTSQNQLAGPGHPEANPPAPYPADIAIQTVRATYMVEGGQPLPGSVLIQANRRYRDRSTGDVVVPNARRVKVVNGALSVDLPAGDDPDLDEPFLYSVHEVVPGGRKFMISVPYNAVGPLRLHDLVVEAEYTPIRPPRIYALSHRLGGV
ncbi:hypothetical protein [Streptomyces sp. CB03238]|uniref:hypothetical protein n=1 Tax=Streptomyces sp. CB03238 TaxID=1907777 RepID=UPI000A112330|nr:hypothetical protein [Streptomyces sp. CB03238]ORT58144.1 hypothetical protein BKD26_19780 [Streptomyces sp. CB03238]